MPMKYDEFHLNDFSAGYDSSSSPEKLADNSLAGGSQDVDFTTEGAVRKRRGYRRIITDSSVDANYTETLGLAQFYDGSEIRALIRVAKDSGTGVRAEYNSANLPTAASNWGSATALEDGSSLASYSEPYADFAYGIHGTNGPSLYIATPELTGPATSPSATTGDSALKMIYYAGSAWNVDSVTLTSDVSSGNRTFDQPVGVEQWFDRIWSFCDKGIESGTYLFYTDVNASDIDVSPTGTWLEVGSEGPITGIKRLGRRLLVFKERATYILSGGEDPLNLLRVDQISESVGCLARRSIVEVDGLVYFFGDEGFYVTDGATIKPIGEKVESELDAIDRSKIGRLFAVHNREDSQVAWFVPLEDEGPGSGYGLEEYGSADYGDGDTDQRCLVYDYNLGAWAAPFTNMQFATGCTYTNSISELTGADEIIVVGELDSSNPMIYQWNVGSTDDVYDSGEADWVAQTVNGSALTKPFALGDPARHKHLRKLYVQLGEVAADVPVAVDVFEDYWDTSSTPCACATQKTTSGSEDNPVYTQTRHSTAASGKHFRFRIRDYNDGTDDGGRWILVGLIGLFSQKGRRA